MDIYIYQAPREIHTSTSNDIQYVHLEGVDRS
jgi:hypothetical protein